MQSTPSPNYSKKYQLDHSSNFGKSINDLHLKLISLCHSLQDPECKGQAWLKAAFPLFREHFKSLDLSKMEFSVNDQMFMMSDPVGDQIRRVYAHQWIAQKLLSAADQHRSELSAKDLEVINKVAHVLSSSGYSRFLGIAKHGEEKVLQDYPESSEILLTHKLIDETVRSAQALSPSGHGFFRKFSQEIQQDCEELCKSASEEWDQVYTTREARLRIDPGHMWMNLVFDLRSLFIWQADKDFLGKLDKLSKPTSFMIVEDNPLHQWAFSPLKHIQGASFYLPHDCPLKSEDFMHFCYPAIKDAKAEIEAAIKNNLSLPGVIVSDIELLDKDQNGLDFVAWLDKTLKEHGRRSEVELVMVYSSNISFYEDRVQQLKSEGVINSSCNKRDFKIRYIIDELSQKD